MLKNTAGSLLLKNESKIIAILLEIYKFVLSIVLNSIILIIQ